MWQRVCFSLAGFVHVDVCAEMESLLQCSFGNWCNQRSQKYRWWLYCYCWFTILIVTVNTFVHVDVCADMESLKEENRRLKDTMLCKVCMEKDISTLFLPCSHLVCCDDCAPSLRNCPICRTAIRGTVRTYISWTHHLVHNMFAEVLFTQVTGHAYLAQYYLFLQMPSVFTIIILLLSERTCTVLTFARAVSRGLNADRTECRPLKRQYMAAMLTQAIRLTITWQCDMVVNSVSRSTFQLFGIPTVKLAR